MLGKFTAKDANINIVLRLRMSGYAYAYVKVWTSPNNLLKFYAVTRDKYNKRNRKQKSMKHLRSLFDKAAKLDNKIWGTFAKTSLKPS